MKYGKLGPRVVGVLALFSHGAADSQFIPCNSPPAVFEITVWANGNFTGACRTLQIGNFANATQIGLANDSVSSLRVGAAVRAILWEHDNFSGRPAVYEAESNHGASFPGNAGLGRGVDNHTSSIQVLDTLGARIPYIYIGNYPSSRERPWSEQAQGLCHTSTDWFITNRHNLFKIPLNQDMTNFDPPAGNVRGIPLAGFDHMGDPACARDPNTGTEYVFVPLEAPGFAKIPRVAVFRASDMRFVNWDVMFISIDRHSGWVALDPTNGEDLWTSGATLPSGGVQIYRIFWPNIESGLFFFGGGGFGTRPGPVLKNKIGKPLNISILQGGVFSADGTLLFLTNHGTSGDGRGIFTLHPDGRYAGQSANAYGLFNLQVSCCFEEIEGLDYLDTDSTVTPNINGQLHVFLLDQDAGRDDISLKHYKPFQ